MAVSRRQNKYPIPSNLSKSADDKIGPAINFTSYLKSAIIGWLSLLEFCEGEYQYAPICSAITFIHLTTHFIIGIADNKSGTMKILHTSDIHLGKSFANLGTAGDKLRAGIKTTFVKVIDLALEQKVDMVIMAGDTFDSVDVSQNLIDFFVSQVKRLGNIPTVILPGFRDSWQKGSFWEEWENPPAANLFPLMRTEKPYYEFENLSATVYGYPLLAETKPEDSALRVKKFGRSEHQIGVVYGTLVYGDKQGAANYPIYTDNLTEAGFDYVALGGSREFQDFTPLNISAAYSGCPETLAAELNRSGCVAIVELEHGATITPIKVGQFEWKEIDIKMEEVLNLDDLRLKIAALSSPNTYLKVTLQGLALLEAGVDTERLQNELSGGLLHLEIADQTRVLPENVSAVKVQEKTILGQYLRVMVDKLNKAEGAYKTDLDESLKLGYTLLTGKEIW